MTIIMLPAYAIAIAIPLLSLWLIYKLDFYKTGNFKIIVASMFAGLAAYLLASQGNKFTLNQGWLDRLEIIRYSAPILEEILKGIILWYLVTRPRFAYFIEGAVYGFAAGIGFAVIENYEYITAAQSSGLMLAISRVISTNLMHAAATSVLGIILAEARFSKNKFNGLMLGMGGLAIAMALHILFNNVATRVENGLLVLIAAGGIGLVSAAVIAYIIKQGLKRGKTVLEESLSMADRVTSGEAAVVTRMESVDDILKPLAERFGDKKAAEIKEFLTKQARLGFLRKSFERLTDERMKQGTEKEIAKVIKEVDIARRKVGSYAMLFLRQTFPEDSSPIWGRLEGLIQERAAARPATGGMNLWSNLKTRQEEQKNQTQQETKE